MGGMKYMCAGRCEGVARPVRSVGKLGFGSVCGGVGIRDEKVRKVLSTCYCMIRICDQVIFATSPYLSYRPGCHDGAKCL